MPAKNPRTECCCQSVAFMIAVIVVPFGADSIFSTADCLEDEAAGAPDNVGFGAAVAASFGRPGTLLLLRCFAARRGLSRAFAVFGFDFRMTGTPGDQRQHHVLPLTKPRQRSGAKEMSAAYSLESRWSSETASYRRPT